MSRWRQHEADRFVNPSANLWSDNKVCWLLSQKLLNLNITSQTHCIALSRSCDQNTQTIQHSTWNEYTKTNMNEVWVGTGQKCTWKYVKLTHSPLSTLTRFKKHRASEDKCPDHGDSNLYMDPYSHNQKDKGAISADIQNISVSGWLSWDAPGCGAMPLSAA